MVATDAACEGLNLQTLGTLINIDLPWNPTRLEQRIGRIKRFGQIRDKVDMLNLVNERTVDERSTNASLSGCATDTIFSVHCQTRFRTNGSKMLKRWAKKWTST